MVSLVSVIIPCYNHSHYLPAAIESVREQTHPSIEIVVVDDGSTDNTKAIAQSYHCNYVYQPNRGLPASRNTGVSNCKGEYLVFLDADDWLYPDAIAVNLHYLQQNPEAAFVSGAYNNVYEKNNTVEEYKVDVAGDAYQRLLHSNFLSVPGAVMYRRRVFDEFSFDVSLRACEDYDLYLRVGREYPIVYHTRIIAAYRRRASSMSGNIPLMLLASLYVLERQKTKLRTIDERRAYNKGKNFWKDYYCGNLFIQLLTGESRISRENLSLLLWHRPYLLLKLIIKYFVNGRLKTDHFGRSE